VDSQDPDLRAAPHRYRVGTAARTAGTRAVPTEGAGGGNQEGGERGPFDRGDRQLDRPAGQLSACPRPSSPPPPHASSSTCVGVGAISRRWRLAASPIAEPKGHPHPTGSIPAKVKEGWRLAFGLPSADTPRCEGWIHDQAAGALAQPGPAGRARYRAHVTAGDPPEATLGSHHPCPGGWLSDACHHWRPVQRCQQQRPVDRDGVRTQFGQESLDSWTRL
jgi:hypothetical protein